ncbi:MAG: hypothetical protein FJ275_01730 [Planctomycetes bacterium]|nr:hypothetical protein [Planctomycetota bacterium]
MQAATAFAAPDAGAKARGAYGFYGQSAHHSFTSARAHVDTYQRYLSETHGIAVPTSGRVEPAVVSAGVAASETVDPEIAREASDAIADDIGRIQRHVDRMQARATSLGDDATLAKLADVEKQLGVARRAHAALHEHHAGEAISPAEAMKLADQVNAALRAAHAEHDEVITRVGTTPNP